VGVLSTSPPLAVIFHKDSDMELEQRILDKLDKLSEDICSVDKSTEVLLNEVAHIKEDLSEHMRRTENLEDRFEPLETNAAMWAGVGKAGGVAGVILAACVSLYKVFGG